MNDSSFKKARIVLTSWYVGILTIILLIFSIALYTQERQVFTRIIVQRDFGGRIPHIFSDADRDEMMSQLQELRTSFIINLLLADGFILVIGGALSFFLAGKTLEPIQQTFEKQKQFLADVSHEIRTPLAAIQTATEVSLRSKDKTTKDYQEVLGQVLDESKRLTKMANDLLLLSRIESFATKPLTDRINLKEVVKTVAQELSPIAKKKKIYLSEFISEDCFIVGNRYQLVQLAMILVDNAIKYTKPGGEVVITVEKKQKPLLRIADTGIGIAKKDIKKIFERFYQIDSSRSGSGNGLGLAIAQKIVQVHNAQLHVESIVGKGSIFTVVFPSA